MTRLFSARDTLTAARTAGRAALHAIIAAALAAQVERNRKEK